MIVLPTEKSTEWCLSNHGYFHHKNERWDDPPAKSSLNQEMMMSCWHNLWYNNLVWCCNVPILKNDGVRQWGWDDIP